jgi:hypothetical protein
MSRVNVEIELPDTLATQAKKAGLLEPEALERMPRSTPTAQMSVVRLVLDTNAAVSGLLWHGNPGKLIDAAQAGSVIRYTTAPLLAELHGVPDDDAVLACAVAAKADVIVSGDPHLLKLKDYQGVPIVTPAEGVGRLGL